METVLKKMVKKWSKRITPPKNNKRNKTVTLKKVVVTTSHCHQETTVDQAKDKSGTNNFGRKNRPSKNNKNYF